MVLFLLKLLSHLPLRFMHGVGKCLGLLVYWLPGRYRQRLQDNARQAGYENAAFARRAAAQTGAMIMEIPKVWLKTNSALARCHNPQNQLVHEGGDHGPTRCWSLAAPWGSPRSEDH